ncbi:DUF7192 family protein [Methylobacterium oryzae]|uniref:DUF7192 family protein n=1 Tax=Methylobacterium oryzae TaxID=334852 RepID=UPI002F353C1A
MGNRIDHFETSGDFIRWLQDTPAALGWGAGGRNQESEAYGGGIVGRGCDTLDEAYSLAETGWPEGLERMKDRVNVLRASGRSRVRIRDVAGDLPDVGAFLAGAPESMTRRVVAESTRRPVLDMIVNCQFQGSVPAESIMNFGAAIALVIDAMENVGVSVALSICSFTLNTGHGNGVFGAVIGMKQAGEPLELDRLVFYTAHPSFQRRLMFGVFERQVEAARFNWGYGGYAEMPDVPEGAIYISARSCSAACSTPEAALRYVKDIVNKARPDLLESDFQQAA